MAKTKEYNARIRAFDHPSPILAMMLQWESFVRIFYTYFDIYSNILSI